MSQAGARLTQNFMIVSGCISRRLAVKPNNNHKQIQLVGVELAREHPKPSLELDLLW